MEPSSKVTPLSFKLELERFDQKFDLLVDYFAIIGYDNLQLKIAVNEILDSPVVNLENSRSVISDTTGRSSENRGAKRGLRATILDRFPAEDRSQIAFPKELVSYFFDNRERIEIIPTGKEDLKDTILQNKLARDNFNQAVLTVLGGNIVYITCHLFYEDLALLSETQ